jgi:surface protein
MFSQCSQLVSLDLSNFNTNKVTYKDEMFAGCDSLKFINLLHYQGENIFQGLQYSDLTICIENYAQINEGGDNDLKSNNVPINCPKIAISSSFPGVSTRTSVIEVTTPETTATETTSPKNTIINSKLFVYTILLQY